MSFKTPDLCDQFEAELGKTVRVVAPMFQPYGGRAAFCGEIVTLKIFEDNTLVREIFGEDGKGKVLVIDGGGSLRCALVGDQLAILAHKNGWEGVVVYGCIRDSGDIAGYRHRRPCAEYASSENRQEGHRRPQSRRDLRWRHLQSR